MKSLKVYPILAARHQLGDVSNTKFYEMANDPECPLRIKKMGSKSVVEEYVIDATIAWLPYKDEVAA
ncbi:hypothetical protein A9Q83_16655 [Alphaproteobacteria bacterium 46_93_T64]|nr:hypothetical protein A9Q83_16655 [Alphaproteobacteria bacterium 46_93_T64]